MYPPSTHIHLNLDEIPTIEALAEITFGIIISLEESFGLEKNWHQTAPPGVAPDGQGLSPLKIENEKDLVDYFISRNWGERFSTEQSSRSGFYYNETVVAQLKPEEFVIDFEHLGPEELGGWRIFIKAMKRKLDRDSLVACGESLRKQNENRCGSIVCVYKTSQKQIGKYMPPHLNEEVFNYQIGPKWL